MNAAICPVCHTEVRPRQRALVRCYADGDCRKMHEKCANKETTMTTKRIGRPANTDGRTHRTIGVSGTQDEIAAVLELTPRQRMEAMLATINETPAQGKEQEHGTRNQTSTTNLGTPQKLPRPLPAAL